eukprot:scaffold106767_cov69-Phaeocystis_antarctica.AAC.5
MRVGVRVKHARANRVNRTAVGDAHTDGRRVERDTAAAAATAAAVHCTQSAPRIDALSASANSATRRRSSRSPTTAACVSGLGAAASASTSASTSASAACPSICLSRNSRDSITRSHAHSSGASSASARYGFSTSTESTAPRAAAPARAAAAICATDGSSLHSRCIQPSGRVAAAAVSSVVAKCAGDSSRIPLRVDTIVRVPVFRLSVMYEVGCPAPATSSRQAVCTPAPSSSPTAKAPSTSSAPGETPTQLTRPCVPTSWASTTAFVPAFPPRLRVQLSMRQAESSSGYSSTSSSTSTYTPPTISSLCACSGAASGNDDGMGGSSLRARLAPSTAASVISLARPHSTTSLAGGKPGNASERVKFGSQTRRLQTVPVCKATCFGLLFVALRNVAAPSPLARSVAANKLANHQAAHCAYYGERE